jgi:hypothetical protein
VANSDPADQPDPTRTDVIDATGATHTGQSVPPPDSPSRWGEFRIIRELGRGGFGRVYCAFDEGLAKEIALKIVRPSDPSRISSVMREGQMLARVRHPNVVTVHAVRRVDDEVGFVMDFIDGETLADRVKRAGRLGAEEAVAIGETLCHALAAVHGAGLLHRDIKTRNVMRDSAGRIMLMDFGAGREESAARDDDQTGTLPYMAPELFQRHPASRASDIYSLGVLLYYLVSGAYPVEAATPGELAEAHASGRRRLLVDRRPDLPPDFIHVVERAIARDPARRYQSAGELIEDLHSLAVRRPPVAGPSPSSWPGRLARWTAVAGVGFVSVVLLGFLATRIYDKTFDVGSYSDESLGTWIAFGLRSVVPGTVLVVMAAVAFLIVRAFWQTIRSAVPPVHRFARRVESTMSSAVSRRTPRDHLVLARWLLLAQVGVMVALAVKFEPLLVALNKPFTTADPSVWQVLYYDGSRVWPVMWYQGLLPIVAAAMGLAWWRLIRSAGGLVALDRPIVVAGFAIVVLLIIGATVPFRVFYDARNLHRHEISGERCYEVGRSDNGDEVRVFCPDVTPSPSHLRIRTEKSSALGPRLGEAPGEDRLSPYKKMN